MKALILALTLVLALPSPTAIAQDSQEPVEEAPATDDTATPAAQPPAATAPARPRKNRKRAAEEFASLLEEAILLEARAQNYERQVLGTEDIERLGGNQLKRRKRIDQDLEDFEERLSAISMEAISIPEAPEGAELSTKEQLALTTLATVYERSRDPRGLQTYMAANESFLSALDWGDRDRATRLRDTILDREANIFRLAGEAHEILKGNREPLAVERMLVMLNRLSPDAQNERSDVNALILEDAELRKQVVDEALAFLKNPAPTRIPADDLDTLSARLPALQGELVEASNLAEVREELTIIEVELADLDVRLADRGVNSLSPTERTEKSLRWAELNNRQSVLHHQWMRTPPAQPQVEELVQAQDDVIQRSMFELGVRGALFAHRYDMQRHKASSGLSNPYSTWELIEEQATLINDMKEARPSPGPMDGLPPPLDRGFLKAQATLLNELKKTRPDLFSRLPPPKKSQSYAIKKSNAPGTTPLGAGGSSGKKSGGKKKKGGW